MSIVWFATKNRDQKNGIHTSLMDLLYAMKYVFAYRQAILFGLMDLTSQVRWTIFQFSDQNFVQCFFRVRKLKLILGIAEICQKFVIVEFLSHALIEEQRKGNGISLVPDRSKNAFVHRMYFSSYMYGGKKCVFISRKKIC